MASSAVTVPAPLLSHTMDLVPREPTRPEILRYLGYQPGRSPAPALSGMIDDALGGASGALHLRGSYALYSVDDRASGTLVFGQVRIVGEVARFVGSASRVAAFVVTAGEAISQRIEEAWRNGDSLTGWVLDALGSWAAETAADALAENLRTHLGPGEALTLRYSPGYCGMDLAEQQSIFRLVDAAAIGVRLLPSLLMQPMKSISGLLGVVPASAADTEASPCARCARQHCAMRR